MTDGVAERTAGARPGSRRGPGKFPGPSLIPALHAIQDRLGWLPREELAALVTRHPPAAVRDRGTGLVLPALPHRRRRRGWRCTSATTCPAGCASGDADRQQLHDRYDDDPDVEVVEVSCLGRCDVAPAAAVNDRPAAAADAADLVAAARDGR